MYTVQKGLLAALFYLSSGGVYTDMEPAPEATPKKTEIYTAAQKYEACHDLNQTLVYEPRPSTGNKSQFTNAIILGRTLCDPPAKTF